MYIQFNIYNNILYSYIYIYDTNLSNSHDNLNFAIKFDV